MQGGALDFSVEPAGVLRSYAFFVVALMFGLPLLISYYAVSQGGASGLSSVAVYLAASLAVGLTLLLRRGRPSNADPVSETGGASPPAPGRAKKGPVAALASATLAVVAFGSMKFLLAASYPYPSSPADLAGGVYVVSLGVAAVIGIPYLVVAAFPFLRAPLSERRLRLTAYLTGALYFVTYEILVNEIVITGYNTAPGNFVQSPLGLYPWAYVFTSGPAPGSVAETAIYTPYVLVQLNQFVNFIFQPFELALAVAMSVLVASAVVATYNLVRRSQRMGGACSASATLSGVGAFLGYTATCPSCLAPTLVSVVFGGVATVQAVYSNLWGAVVPPIVSVAALAVSLYVVGRGYGRTPAPPTFRV
ncbi:MAG: hypothetical protein JRN08_03875 [Nitrososphaerota archaeon]|nr:hypothetical protein [Nitrososphaerota archaeon]